MVTMCLWDMLKQQHCLEQCVYVTYWCELLNKHQCTKHLVIYDILEILVSL